MLCILLLIVDGIEAIYKPVMDQTSIKPIEIRPIRDSFELWDVYSLTHDCYVETNYIRPRPTGMLVHYAEFDHLPETTILVALQDGEIIGSISYTIDGPAGFIIEKDYREECQRIRQEKGRRLADYWRFVVKKSCRSGQQVLMALMTQSGLDLLQKGVNTFFLDVHEKHEGAYKRLFNGVTVARKEGVPGLEQQHIAAVLIRWDAERLPNRWLGKIPGRSLSALSIVPRPNPPSVKPGLENAKQMAEKYENRIQSARQRFNASDVIQLLTCPDTEAEFLLRFLINYCAYAVSMDQPTESWIRRAGEHCLALGLMQQDEIFKIHAKQQANLHLLLIADVKALGAFWNKRFKRSPLDVEKLLARPNPPAVLHFQKLHEEIIAGQEPYRQFAIKYESDRLAIEYGAWLVKRCVKAFGEDVLARLTFLQKKVILDSEQSQFNWLELGKLLAAHPDFFEGLITTGESALEAYQQVLEDCVAATQNLAKQAACTK